MVFLANDRENNSRHSYDSIRVVAQQVETDGFDSIWLADHLFYRKIILRLSLLFRVAFARPHTSSRRGEA